MRVRFAPALKRWSFLPLLLLVCAVLGTTLVSGENGGLGLGTLAGAAAAVVIAVLIDRRRLRKGAVTSTRSRGTR